MIRLNKRCVAAAAVLLAPFVAVHAAQAQPIEVVVNVQGPTNHLCGNVPAGTTCLVFKDPSKWLIPVPRNNAAKIAFKLDPGASGYTFPDTGAFSVAAVQIPQTYCPGTDPGSDPNSMSASTSGNGLKLDVDNPNKKDHVHPECYKYTLTATKPGAPPLVFDPIFINN